MKKRICLTALFIFAIFAMRGGNTNDSSISQLNEILGFRGIGWLQDIDAIGDKIMVKKYNDKVEVFSKKNEYLQYGGLMADRIFYIAVNGEFVAGSVVVTGNDKAYELLYESIKRYGPISESSRSEKIRNFHGYWDIGDVLIFYNHKEEDEVSALMISYKPKLHEVNSFLAF